MKIINEKLEIAMAKSCMTSRELGIKSGIRPETLARIKKGLQNPNPATIGKIARALNVGIEELVETTAATVNQK